MNLGVEVREVKRGAAYLILNTEVLMILLLQYRYNKFRRFVYF